MREFVLEIGAENIPASYLPPAIAQLRDDTRAMLTRLRLVHGDVYVTGTPRRLVVVVSDLGDRQEAGEDVLTGPPVARAFGDDGTPTPAATGFARAQGVDVVRLERVQTPRGEYVAVRRRLPRRATPAVLRDELPGLIAALRFPKTMKWEASGARFARPVRWIVALYGRDVVPVRFADVASGRVTCARPWMRDERRSIPDARSYAEKVGAFGVILDHDERRRRIHDRAAAAASRLGARIIEDDDLITELAFMTEDPRPLVGTFDRRFLELPPEVVVVAMRSHQRYVALTDARGKLLPSFVTFTDGPVTAPKRVVVGNERVLRARLADAEFYWNDDARRGVDGLAAELDRIVFIEGLGSLGDKWRRILAIGRVARARIADGGRVADAAMERAARLCKADLASTMIRDGKEFTALQGVIGAYYAVSAGEDEAVSRAIREHYLPRGAGDALPDTVLGRLLALADRMDTLAGCFLAGMKPSGSQDPYALRRGGNGAVRLAAALPGVRLDELIECAATGYEGVLSAGEVRERWTSKGTGDELREFVRGRVETFLKENGIPYDVAGAVLAVSWSEPGSALARGRDLAALRGDARFERLITGVKRVGNILPAERRLLGEGLSTVRDALSGDGDGRFSASRFEDAAEGALLDAVLGSLDPIGALEAEGNFRRVLLTLADLAGPIDAYFDRVLVNAPDPSVRDNRHAFLEAVYALFGRFADFQAIVEQGDAA